MAIWIDIVSLSTLHVTPVLSMQEDLMSRIMDMLEIPFNNLDVQEGDDISQLPRFLILVSDSTKL
jgi:hypothetical protein